MNAWNLESEDKLLSLFEIAQGKVSSKDDQIFIPKLFILKWHLWCIDDQCDELLKNLNDCGGRI